MRKQTCAASSVCKLLSHKVGMRRSVAHIQGGKDARRVIMYGTVAMYIRSLTDSLVYMAADYKSSVFTGILPH